MKRKKDDHNGDQILRLNKTHSKFTNETFKLIKLDGKTLQLYQVNSRKASLNSNMINQYGSEQFNIA